MNYLTVEGVSKSFGERVLFEDITFYINQGDRVAFIAKNGTGKTSLMDIIMKKEEASSGKVWLHHKISIGYLSQDPNLDLEATVFQAVYNSPNPIMKAILAYEKSLLNPSDIEAMQEAMSAMDRMQAWDYEFKIKQILSKLKVDYMDRKIKMLSGGQKKRVALAKVLIDAPEFLILDEPTNHLDLDMIEWLEEYLKQGKHTIFMVTHDRYFLDSVCNQILELDQQQIFKYTGDYSYYLEKKADRESNFAATTEKAKNLYRKELDWMRRQPKARGTKAKARIDKFFEVEKKAKRSLDNEEVILDIKMTRLGSKIIELHNIHKSYGEHVILKGFDYKFKKGDRVGIVGKNGAGKTTLLNMIVGKEKVDAGKIVIGDTIVIGYYTQSGMNLKEDHRVIDVIRNIAEFIPMHKGQKLTAVQLCERFLFDSKKQQTYVSKLSGGERRRLYLLTIIMQNPNFLILDEPTNDLDIITLQVLEEFLQSFPGCIVIVSHDRHFMDKIVEHTFVLEGDGLVRDFPGNYSAYRAVAKQEAIEAKAEEKELASEQPTVKTASKISQEERKEIKRLERQISKLEEQKANITAQFNDTNLTPEKITELSKELNELNENLEEKELRWMELVDELG
ncbi:MULTISPECIES: ABC-F family ATP-binding cassette domain-containing protein [unclassified Aureispira]|uniref:ABC-F family ATP-binding cassette domain-containing protein n=1 Tax=unclassified Aureispira TaxID=2649989 RepID=UPI0006975138|nr:MULTISPECIES: ABC-F family ATP-binding cassette domain-containing protein [unclassified Aureispira]WMX16178.1 ABC-F family ATP-binding cassette domain-containing protein [Aureispira sp. CCB-E]